MENTRTYSVKGILTALGKSLLYLLFFLAVQLLAGILYAPWHPCPPAGRIQRTSWPVRRRRCCCPTC